MHTDEFEISLSRELDVCRSRLRDIEAFLGRMEAQYHMKSEAFAADFRSGKLTGGNGDFAAWADQYEALMRWKKLQDDYEALFYDMKI